MQTPTSQVHLDPHDEDPLGGLRLPAEELLRLAVAEVQGALNARHLCDRLRDDVQSEAALMLVRLKSSKQLEELFGDLHHSALGPRLRGYVSQVVRNALKSVKRFETRGEPTAEAVEAVTPADADPAAQAEHRDERLRMFRRIRRLNWVERQSIYDLMRGRGHDEIARRRRISRHASAHRRARAVRKVEPPSRC